MIDPRGIMNQIPMLRFCVIVALGIWAADAVGDAIQPLEWLLAALATCLLALWGIKKENIGSLLVFLALFYLGAFLMANSKTDDVVYSKSHLACEGVVISEPVEHGKVYQCDVIVTKGWLARPAKIKANIRKYDENGHEEIPDKGRGKIKVGDGLRWVATIQPLHSWRGADKGTHFDYKRWMRIHGYEGNTFMARGCWKLADVDKANLAFFQRIRISLLELRSQLVAKLRAAGLSDDALPIIVAMTMGERSWISKDP